MNTDDLMGRWISFLAEPQSVGYGLPDPGRKRFCGQVIGAKPMAPATPGNVPTAAVTVRGRSGKQMTIDFSACFARVHDSQADAIRATEQPVQVLPPRYTVKLLGELPDGTQVWRCDDGSSAIFNPTQ